MNIGTLHRYLGQLIDAGVDPTLPIAGIAEGWPREICDVLLLTGSYDYDPSPKMMGNVCREGTVLALLPANEDAGGILSNGTHREGTLPVDPPYPA